MLLAGWVASRWPLDEAAHAEVQARLAERNAKAA
jgi:Na+/melibiose symporter-like transporter